MKRIKGWMFDIESEKHPINIEIPEEYKEKPEKYFDILCEDTNDLVKAGFKGFLLGFVEV